MSYYIYILYSNSGDKYYVGYSADPEKRLQEHNSYKDKSKYTSKFQPWELKVFFFVSKDIGEAMKVERFIKKQKSRRFLEKLISSQPDAEMINSIINKVIG